MAEPRRESPRAPALGWSRLICTLSAGLSVFGPLPVRAAPGAREPVPPAAEPPHVKLTVEPAETEWTWLVHVESTDSMPIRLVGDARLLSLDITPPAAKPPKRGRVTTVHCTLPEEMRPSSDEERVQIVPPKLVYTETFDPRLYCFEPQKAHALTAGAVVVARFGFAPGHARHPAPPFVVAPADGESGRGGSKEIVSEPFTLPDSLPEFDDTRGQSPPADTSTPLPTVSTPDRIDAATLADVSLPITVTNPTPRPIRLLLRPETIAIDATGPSGTTRCQWLVIPSPIAELFTTLPPKGRSSTEVLVSTLCPAAFFDLPGLYKLRAAIDTRLASGTSIGIRSFEGEVWSPSTTLVRIHMTSRQRRSMPR